MESQKCPSCSAPMRLVNNLDGTDSFVCDYCGNVINMRPKTVADRIFKFVNRAARALKEETPLSPEEQAIQDAYREKEELEYKQYLQKELQQAKKALEKQKRKMGL